MYRSWINCEPVKKRLRPVALPQLVRLNYPVACASRRLAVTVHPVYVLFLVLEDLAVKLVHQGIDCRVHILVFSLCVNLATNYVEGSFSHLANFLNFQRHLTVTDVVKVALKLLELGVDVILQCRGQFYVMAWNVELHWRLLLSSCRRSAGLSTRASCPGEYW